MGPVELASCSFGQSSKVSYLQMLTAVCAVVNGGRLMQPYVVRQILDENYRPGRYNNKRSRTYSEAAGHFG